MWLMQVILGLILFWLGMKILRGSRRPAKIASATPAMDAIALERKRALDKAQELLAQTDRLMQQQKSRLTGLDTAIELNSQVAMDAVLQFERAKAIIEALLIQNGCSREQIEDVLSSLEKNVNK